MCSSEGRDETTATTGHHNPPATNEQTPSSCLYYFFHFLAIPVVGKDIARKIFCWVLKTISRKKDRISLALREVGKKVVSAGDIIRQ